MSEKELARQLGVSRDRLRAVRAGLVEGTHWRKERRMVVWLPEGCVAARGAVLEAVGAVAGAIETPTSSIEAPKVEEADIDLGYLKVIRRVLNPRIVMCVRVADAAGTGANGAEPLQRVVVRSSENFTPGMVLRARRVESDLWELAGRCPRWKGRW